MAEQPNADKILETLRELPDPELNLPLGRLQMVKQATPTSAGGWEIVIELPTPAYPRPERVREAVQRAVAPLLPEQTTVDVEITATVRGKRTGGKLGLHCQNVIAVGSGKGGVGKSTVAAALAFGLKSSGCKVGLMDADVYGPSIPHMVGAHGQPAAIEQKTPDGQTIQRLEPVDADGVKVISMGYFVEPDKAVIWRGPLLHRAITQFLQDTEWGELDYLIIDLPPGTGDVSLTLSQLLGLAGAVVVCTPQQVALLDAVKAIAMFRQVKIPVLGIVENMAGEIFGRGGAQQKAADLNVPFLGEVPIEAEIRVLGDAGQIAKLFEETHPAREPLLHVCQRTAMQIARQLLETPSMPTLEML